MTETPPEDGVVFELNVLVEVCSLDNATFEIANTIDVSQHGAR